MGQQPAKSSGQSDRLALAQDTLEKIAELMQADVVVSSREEEEQICLDLDGDDAGALIGKKGRTLDALQLIVNKIVSRQPGPHKLVAVDCGGYRARRAASLSEMAKRLADKARDERKIIRLNPMSARDRRIIHLTLADEPGLATRSEGEGEERHLLIVPE